MTSVDPTPASGMDDWQHRDGCTGSMNAERAAYFIDRFKREEKWLGPHEQWALDFILATLRSAETSAAVGGVDGWRCDNCGCRTYARVDILVEGKFQPGPDVRCVECKDVSAYFETDWQRELGPEECADADMSYWGEE